jgi:hypothetical protein
MFLKTPRVSTDQRVRSLLQKAARRGYADIVELAMERLDYSGDKAWLRSRSVVITFEECWPLAAPLVIDRELSSKRTTLQKVTRSAKQKDAAGLGALAYAYHEGDQSVLESVPNRYSLRLIAEALKRPSDFFEWVLGQARNHQAIDTIRAAQRYLPVATWQWDKACILAGALLALGDNMAPNSSEKPTEEFPYWVALDKHTPEGKAALAQVAKEVNVPYRQLIWASFYLESARVNRLLPSLWWQAEQTWRLRCAGLSLGAAEDLWSRAQPLVRRYLEGEAMSLRKLVETAQSTYLFPAQEKRP